MAIEEERTLSCSGWCCSRFNPLYWMPIPCILLIFSLGIFIYRCKTQRPGDLEIKEFLFQTQLQITPLVLIRWRCAYAHDRIALLCRFATKVLLMFLSLYFFRVTMNRFCDLDDQAASGLIENGLSGLAIWLMLTFGFKLSWWNILASDHRDLQILHVVAILYVAVSGYAYGQRDRIVAWTVVAFWNSIEICTFVPAVYLLVQMSSNADVFLPLPDSSSKYQALMFGIVLNVIYFHENVVSPYYMGVYDPLYLGGHGAHYGMLLEFTFFFLWQVWCNPNKKPGDDELPSKNVDLKHMS